MLKTDWLCRAAVAFLNDPAVRVAIHAAPFEVAGMWIDCTNRISYNKSQLDTVGVVQDLIGRGMLPDIHPALTQWPLLL